MNNSIAKKQLFSLQDIVFVGVMAAIIFTLTYFIKIEIPTPVGPTMLKISNGFCLLAGILFGGLKGGLAAGIGSMIFDLTNPAYVSSAPFTLIFFFVLAFVCGIISHLNNKKGESLLLNIIAGIAGGLSYYILYFAKNIIELVIAGSDFSAAIIGLTPKFITSGINVIVAVVIVGLLSIPLKQALKRIPSYSKSN